MAAGLLSQGCASLAGGGNRRPNIVCIVSDEMALDYVGCYGGNRLTPNLDELASGGVRFREAYCVAALCTPSRYSILTGRHPGRCRHPSFRGNYPTSESYVIAWNTGITRDAPCMGRLLSQAGYYTGFAGKWGVPMAPEFYEQQRPTFEPGESAQDPDVDRRLRRKQEQLVEGVRKSGGFDYAASVQGNNPTAPLPELRHHHFEWITRGALDFLESAEGRNQPFFLYVATTAVHGPNHANDIEHDPRYTPAGMQTRHIGAHPPRRTIRSRLEAAGLPVDGINVGMLFLDDHVGVLMRRLRQMGAAQNTLVIFVPDHNVEPGKTTCYQRGVHVPMIASWSARVAAAGWLSQRVSLVDLLPTLLDAAQVGRPKAHLDGRSLLPLLTRGAPIERNTLYFEAGNLRAVLKGDYKYIAFRYPPDAERRMREAEVDVALDHMNGINQSHASIALHYHPGYFDPDQLYHLADDPYEQHNLAADPEYQGKLHEMREELRDVLQSFDHPYPLDDAGIMGSQRFAQLVEARRASGIGVSWWNKDFHWPPER